jgi:hypothetical protein
LCHGLSGGLNFLNLLLQSLQSDQLNIDSLLKQEIIQAKELLINRISVILSNNGIMVDNYFNSYELPGIISGVAGVLYNILLTLDSNQNITPSSNVLAFGLL